MRITYDPTADAAYVYLVEIPAGGVAQTVPLDPREVDGQINLDIDADGRLLGIEVLDASRLLPSAVLEGATWEG